MTDTLPSDVAGVRIPRTRTTLHAIGFARETMSDVLFHHVLRTYVFGALRIRADFDEELAFLGCLLHDLGLLRAYWTPAERFEVDGADAARRYLEEQAVPADRIDVVWDAVALHTSIGIAVRKRPEIAIVALGSALDFGGVGIETLPDGAVDAVVGAFPRLDFKKDALATMADMCAGKPAGVLMHYFAEVGRRHVPGFSLPYIDDILLAAPFAE